MAILRLANMRFFGHHGVSEDERKKGGEFEVDCEIRTDITAAVAGDNINDALDYERIFHIVKEHVENRSFKLMESMADSLLREILRLPNIENVRMKIRKLSPPVSGKMDYFEVDVSG